MHIDFRLEETVFQRRLEHFPGSFGCPLLRREDSYEECKDDPAGAAASQQPVEGAVYCENCERVSNSTNFRCGVCGSDAILSLRLLIDGPPSGPESGPAAAGCIIPIHRFQTATAA